MQDDFAPSHASESDLDNVLGTARWTADTIDVSPFQAARAEFLQRVERQSERGAIPQRQISQAMRPGRVGYLGTRRFSSPARIRWFAAVAVVAVGFLAVNVYGRWADNRFGAATVGADLQMVTHVTASGERKKIELPDGSSVVLGVQSELQLPRNFGAQSRTVRLTGEALFTVTSDRGVPFIVRAGQSTVKVLGTAFTVRNYPTDSAVHVVVAAGKVAVDNHVLSVGDRGTVYRGDVAVAYDTNIADALAWTEGKLTFQRVPLRDAIKELERWYGIRIDVQDSALLSRRISTTLTTEPAQQAMDLIAMVVQGRVRWTNERVVFY